MDLTTMAPILLTLCGVLVGTLLTAVGVYLGASLYAKASGQRAPMQSNQPLQFVVKDDSTEAVIDKAMADDLRRKYEEELEGTGGDSLGRA